MNNNELKHHGVKGMKWGKRKAQNPTDSEQRGKNENKKNKNVKKAIAIGVGVAAATLAAYGAYKIHQIKQQNIAIGKSRAQAVFDMYSMIGQRDKGLHEYNAQVTKVKKQSLRTAYKNVKEAHKNLKTNSGYYGDHIKRMGGVIKYLK